MLRQFVTRSVLGACAAAVLVVSLAGGALAAVTLYGGTGGPQDESDLLVLDPATGALVSSRGPTDYGLTGLAISPIDGTLYGVTTNHNGATTRQLVTIDRATGVATVVGPLGVQAVADITFGPDGTLYGWDEPSADDLVTINLTTGAATIVGDAGLGTFGSGLAFDMANNRLLLAGDGTDGDLYAIDPATGASSVVTTLDLEQDDGSISALAYGCDGQLYGVALTEFDGGDTTPLTNLVTINVTTGHVTVLGPSVNLLDAIAFDCTPEPQPEPEQVIEIVPALAG